MVKAPAEKQVKAFLPLRVAHVVQEVPEEGGILKEKLCDQIYDEIAKEIVHSLATLRASCLEHQLIHSHEIAIARENNHHGGNHAL